MIKNVRLSATAMNLIESTGELLASTKSATKSANALALDIHKGMLDVEAADKIEQDLLACKYYIEQIEEVIATIRTESGLEEFEQMKME